MILEITNRFLSHAPRIEFIAPDRSLPFIATKPQYETTERNEKVIQNDGIGLHNPCDAHFLCLNTNNCRQAFQMKLNDYIQTFKCFKSGLKDLFYLLDPDS